MKKVGMMLVAGLLVTGAIAQDVTSVNVVGFNKIAVQPGKLELMTLPFESFEDPMVKDLIGSQLPSGLVYIWDRVGRSWKSFSPGRGGVWDATNLIYRGDAFFVKNSGTEPVSISLLGEVPYTYNNSATTTLFNIQGADAVGYAYPVDMVWTNSSLAQKPEVQTLWVWSQEAGSYVSYSRGRGGVWVDAVVIPAGRAFFVKVSSPVDWTEIAPYDL